jgi:uncharacterized repeat protein (TIGR04138 family)
MAKKPSIPVDAELLQKFEQVVREDGRYAPEAFAFVQRGLEFATRRKHGRKSKGRSRHVTGQELCLALRELARREWGALAGVVLRQWNIRRTRDFGEMVYLMIDLGMMGKQDADDITDFDDVYDLDSSLRTYEIPFDNDDDDGDGDGEA